MKSRFEMASTTPANREVCDRRTEVKSGPPVGSFGMLWRVTKVAAASVPAAGAPAMGSEQAPLTLVEFTDGVDVREHYRQKEYDALEKVSTSARPTKRAGPAGQAQRDGAR